MDLEAVPLSREQTLHIALGMGKALLKNGAETLQSRGHYFPLLSYARLS